ncbi:uncharacterized protein LOC135586211 isoform X3 [Musa acuminata AAA Group]|uniref:uncharacterized protein LOC135586211 isoform X3 n=1 Tax=Musa acuminata AAA Group TaxID=214697 RepID=UPI0031E00045
MDLWTSTHLCVCQSFQLGSLSFSVWGFILIQSWSIRIYVLLLKLPLEDEWKAVIWTLTLVRFLQVQPSPTTGTLNMSSAMDKTICSDTLSSQRHTSDVSAYDGRNPEDFQFKPQVGASYSLGLSSLRPMVSAGLIKKEHEPSMQSQNQSQAEAASGELQPTKLSVQNTRMFQSDPSEPISSKYT